MRAREVRRVTEVLVQTVIDATDNASTGGTLAAELLTDGRSAGVSSLAGYDPDYAVANEPVSASFAGLSWGQAELDAMSLRFTVAAGDSAWALKNLVVSITYADPSGGGGNNNRSCVRRGLRLRL